jgi:hypothetical protein
MKAEIGKHGELIITPSTITEEFAIKHWYHLASVTIVGTSKDESKYIRGSKVILFPAPEFK